MRFLLCDDHALFREGLQLVLGQLDDPVELVGVGDAESALAIVRENDDLDLVLLDLDLPRMSGFEALAILRREHPAVPVVVLSASERSADARAALEGGASGFIPKSTRGEVLLAAIRLVLSGGIYVPSLMLEGASAADTGLRSGPRLSARQLDVLRLLAKGLSNQQIGERLAIAPGTVKSHITRLYDLLGVDNRTAAAARLRDLESASEP